MVKVGSKVEFLERGVLRTGYVTGVIAGGEWVMVECRGGDKCSVRVDDLTVAPKQSEKAIATTRLRARTLLKDGYTIRLSGGGLFLVYPPGEKPAYKVWIDRDDTGLLVQCNCPLFGMYEECKHSIAILNLVEKALRVVENLEGEPDAREL